MNFRVWDTILNKYIKFNPFLFGQPGYVIEKGMGVLDCHGKEIYEGDLVIVGQNHFEVKYGKFHRNVESHWGDAVFPVEIIGFYFMSSDLPFLSITDNQFGIHDLQITKIIGHIHEI